MSRVLEIASSPHVHKGSSVGQIMWNVVLALLPVTAFAVYAFGLCALLVLLTATLSCVFFEQLVCWSRGRVTTVSDGSALITGLLYGLTLPPALPLWMVVVGAGFAMFLGKHLFGGLGFNCFNPALVGRAMLQASFPLPMTTWLNGFEATRFSKLAASCLTPPFSAPEVDVITSATPLSAWKFQQQTTDVTSLAFGTTSGSAGETCSVLILLGGAWLVLRHMMNWRIVAAVLGSVALGSAILYELDPVRYPSPAFMLCSGGLMLGAVFMATDMVGSPMTNRGCVLYGAAIGALVLVIRVWGGMPEGVMYAILLGNALTPHIDRLLQPRVFGAARQMGSAS